MKPTTNFRDAHFDVHISQQARDALKQAEAAHFAATEEMRPATFAAYVKLEADLKHPDRRF